MVDNETNGRDLMGKIPESYLPPEELRPQRIYTLEEFKNIPQTFNSTEVLLDRTAEKYGDRVAVFFDDQKITYKQLQASVNRVANGLKKLGVEEGDRVMMRMPNIPPVIVCNFAVIKIGAVSLPTSVLFARTEIAHVANLAEAKVLIVAAAMLGEVEAARPDLKTIQHIVVVGGDENEVRAKGYIPYPDLMKNPDQCAAVQRDRMDVSVLLFTSGTTGLPKGTAHFMEESLIVADGFGKYCWEVSDKDVIGGPAPIAMAAGYSTVAVIPFRYGAAVSLIPRFEPVAMFKNIQNHGITIMSALPTAYRKMLVDINPKDWNYSSLRFCTGGGEALTAKTYLDWKEKFGLEIYEGLGTTEMMFVFISAAVTKKVKPGWIGTACPGYDVRVVNESFEPVKPGEVGKMIARGPTGTIYWRDNEKQKAAVKDGWCLAGDVVTMDEEGNVQFLSREDDLIKSSGYRIGPEEIEEALVTHTSVADAGVVGVPDPVMGQRTKAFVVLKPGVAASEDLKKELVEHCKGKIAVYKLPREIEFIDAMPRTAVGKLLRRVLRQKEIEKAKA
jgi:2-aminobenzoate-CoA ligase